MNTRLLLILDGVLLAVWAGAVAAGSWSFFYLGLVLVGAIVWLEGGLRFRRIRRIALELAATLGQLARLRRPSNAALRNLAILAGVLVLLIVINQLSLAAPGRGRGLSVPTGGLTMDFSFSSTGGALVSGFWMGVILLLAAALFARLYRPIAELGDGWRSRTFFVCLSLFLLLPAAYSIALLFSPADPKASVTYDQILMRTMLSILATAFAAIVALPLVRASQRVPAPVVAAAAAGPPR